jgi:hypothetical protein
MLARAASRRVIAGAAFRVVWTSGPADDLRVWKAVVWAGS